MIVLTGWQILGCVSVAAAGLTGAAVLVWLVDPTDPVS